MLYGYGFLLLFIDVTGSNPPVWPLHTKDPN